MKIQVIYEDGTEQVLDKVQSHSPIEDVTSYTVTVTVEPETPTTTGNPLVLLSLQNLESAQLEVIKNEDLLTSCDFNDNVINSFGLSHNFELPLSVPSICVAIEQRGETLTIEEDGIEVTDWVNYTTTGTGTDKHWKVKSFNTVPAILLKIS